MPVLKVHASAWDIEPMVQSEDMRREFVARLKKALAHAHIPEWGAGVRLAEMTGKTPKASSKWWNAESMPARSNMVAIANELGVRVEWLQYGEGPMLAISSPVSADDSTATPEPAKASPPLSETPAYAQVDKYHNATPEHRKAVDDLVDQLLDLSPEQALKVKQAMELLLPPHDPRKD